jgi:murein DD-endopeptidase MepM/ murein hydrolase activator NlpD
MTPELTAGVDAKLRQISAATGDRVVDRDAIRRLAQEFESLLMTQMIREMRRSMLDTEDTEGLGSAALMDTGDVELGRALSAAGGFGLIDALLSAFERLAPPTGETPQTGYHATLASPAVIDSVPSRPPVVPESVNSTFGWRSDPITGRPRFHNGVDIAAAYGSNVEAAGAGRVAFAGAQGGYGETVLIDHGGGRQTRYAHLSELLVKAGDTVQAGQVVGRAGSSGRSTGPHLHFEVLVNGTPVDPRTRFATEERAVAAAAKGLRQAVD